MSKFSSYPEHQLIFENWRKHCDPVSDIFIPPPPPPPSNINETIERINEGTELNEVAPAVVAGGVVAAAALYGRVSDDSSYAWLGRFLDWVSEATMLIGLVFDPFDFVTAIIEWIRGRPFWAVVSICAAIPGFGIGIRGVQFAAKGGKHGSKAIRIAIAGMAAAALGPGWVSQGAGLIKEALDKFSDRIRAVGEKLPMGGEHAETAATTMTGLTSAMIEYFKLTFSEAGAEAGEDPASDAAPQQAKQAASKQAASQQATQAAAPVAGGGQAPPAKAGDKVVEIPGDRTYIYILHADGTSTAYKRGNPPKFFRGPFPKNSATSLKIAQNAK